LNKRAFIAIPCAAEIKKLKSNLAHSFVRKWF